MRSSLRGATRVPALALAFALSACGGDESGESTSVLHTIYVGDEAGVAMDCEATRPIDFESTAVGDELVTEAVRRAISGVRPSPTMHPPGTAPLRDYFRGVRVENEVAVIAFDGAALAYLNSAACMQLFVKAPILRTVRELTGLEEVAWEIDGEIFTAWDA